MRDGTAGGITENQEMNCVYESTDTSGEMVRSMTKRGRCVQVVADARCTATDVDSVCLCERKKFTMRQTDVGSFSGEKAEDAQKGWLT